MTINMVEDCFYVDIIIFYYISLTVKIWLSKYIVF